MFHNKDNKDGLVRDHRYSRCSGFRNSVPADLLKHPCNCDIITRKENTKKAWKDKTYKDSDSITLEQLVNLIWNFDKDYSQQEKCVNIIKEKYMNLLFTSLPQEGSNVQIGGNL